MSFPQIETIFQRIPQGGNLINRHPLNNGTNGTHNNSHPPDITFRFSNLINNNASANNNNINHQSANHHVAEPQLSQSQSSEGAILRGVLAPGQRYPSINNDLQRRSDNYQTTSEGSTSPESSSESSAEEWESGEL